MNKQLTHISTNVQDMHRKNQPSKIVSSPVPTALRTPTSSLT